MEHAERIARLGAAAEGSRELDTMVHLASGLAPPVVGLTAPVAPYTTSLDAALTLVPAGMWWTVAAGKIAPNDPLFGAAIYRPDYLAISSPIAVGEHPTSAAIALCIACFGARQGGDK